MDKSVLLECFQLMVQVYSYTTFKGPICPKMDVRDYLKENLLQLQIFSNVFVSEDFLEILLPNLAYTLVHFRPLNTQTSYSKRKNTEYTFRRKNLY